MEPIVITLDGVPCGKGRPRFSRKTGGCFTPAKTRNYESDLKVMAQIAMVGKNPLEGALQISIYAAFPVPASWSQKKRAAALAGEIRPAGKPDYDNVAKIVGDALNQIVWRDDSQIVSAAVHKHYSEKPTLKLAVWGASS
ncbi:MAG TPA: RusA family crossover junction endodeoxyribonuclease [Aliidongia sp.]|uniref:RusA family crossover junction endodeoxyribonuclease n=1 Tax=Aliidongia sp. TaxID=1914230 RepID=UPI002DDCC399|nr:RusA family crossover junction endodeoxyribonuclease [Aliidongia sp.]HEV2674118.1 RusA family crossover junction endodeoxyribonuclease [Aliidongia sp.]